MKNYNMIPLSLGLSVGDEILTYEEVVRLQPEDRLKRPIVLIGVCVCVYVCLSVCLSMCSACVCVVCVCVCLSMCSVCVCICLSVYV